MNKRGDVATATLFIIALVLGITALYMFSTVGSDTENYSSNTNKLIESVQFYQDYVVGEAKFIAYRAITCKENCGNSLKETYKTYSEKEFNLLTDGDKKYIGNLFARVRNNDFTFEKRGDVYYLEVKELFVLSDVQYSRMKRNFDLIAEFDSQGNLIRFINK